MSDGTSPDPHAVPHFCANPACNEHLGLDPVLLITTRHVRKFCTVDCIVEGLRIVRARHAEGVL